MSGIWIPTYSGLEVNLLDPDPRSITVADIAHHLASQNRYLGASIRPYTVAEHSVKLAWVAGRMLEAPSMGEEADHLYWTREALMHDAHEAYVADLPRMIVRAMGECLYQEIKDTMDQAIRRRFGLAEEMDVQLGELDRSICHAESRSGLFKNPNGRHTLAGYLGNGKLSIGLEIERQMKEYPRRWDWTSWYPNWGWSWKQAESAFLYWARFCNVE